MIDFLKKIYVVQQQKEKQRLNPLNPFAYMIIFFVIIYIFFMRGYLGLKNELELSNPFKYD